MKNNEPKLGFVTKNDLASPGIKYVCIIETISCTYVWMNLKVLNPASSSHNPIILPSTQTHSINLFQP